MEDDVAAHGGAQTHHYSVHFPEHPARTTDPHYRDFNAYHRKTRVEARCYVGQHIGFGDCRDAQGAPCVIDAKGQQTGLELHHAHIEFSLQNGVDLAALEQDYPGISNPDEVGAWVETAINFRWLCVTPDTTVLMADGALLPIEDVQSGDMVIGHDGFAHLVTAVGRRRYRGEIVRLTPSVGLTLDHAVLTSAGWLAAGKVDDQLGMLDAQMLSVRGVAAQVLGSVVGSVPVDVVNPFARDAPANVPFRKLVQTHEAALVGAVVGRTLAPVRPGPEVVAADRADEHRCLRWLTVDHPVRTLFSGWVHDISVAHSHSFIAGGIAVHNCVFHHRAAGGAHTASHSDFEGSIYVPGLIS